MKALLQRFLRFFGFGSDRVVEWDENSKLEDIDLSKKRGRKKKHKLHRSQP